MKAVRIHTYGDPSVLIYEDAPRPTPKAEELLIRVHATTVNPFDCAARSGYMTDFIAFEMPQILGLDISGVVEEIGADVTEFAPGDEVYARPHFIHCGAYAEFAVVATTDVALKPPSLTHVQAASLPHSTVTAWRALMDVANLSAGQSILIHAAAGGVGTVAVQLAKWRGAKVFGTASGHNMDFLREIGVDEPIDYSAVAFEEVVHDMDVVLDAVGGDVLDRSWQVLKPGGILVGLTQPPSPEKAAEYRVRQQFALAAPPAAPILNELTNLVETGIVKPVVASVFPLEQTQKAHEIVWGRHVRGKVVIQVVA